MKKRSFTIRVGPLALSLAAAAVTAVAFAAISLADSGSGGGGGNSGSGAGVQTFRAGGPAGAGPVTMFRDNLSAADRQKMEEFRQCMQDNGAPGPPDPGKFDPSNPPKPPSAADQEKLKQAWEACKDKLPEDMQNAGPPQLRVGGDCVAPPPGTPGESGKNQNQDQSNDSSSSSSGSSS